MFDRDFEASLENFAKEIVFFVCVLILVGWLSGMMPKGAYIFVGAYFILLSIRGVTWLLAFVIPMLRKMGYMVVDFAEAMTVLYNMTLLPFARFCILAYRFVAKREKPDFSSFSQEKSRRSSQEQEKQYSYHQQAHNSSSQQHEEEERFRRRQEQRRREDEQKQKSQRSDEETRSCFDILGIPSDTDYATAKKAYRDLLKKYHPDHVSHLGKEFQDIATEKVKEIQFAWEAFELLWKLKNG